MKTRLAPPLLVLASILATSIAHASSAEATLGYSVPHTDPSISDDGQGVGVGAGTNRGTDSHSITVQWEIDLTYTHSLDDVGRPVSIKMTYTLNQYATADLSLAPMNPPSGGGQGYASVLSALANTGSINRSTQGFESSLTAGPVSHDNAVTPTIQWVYYDDFTVKATVFVESTVHSAQARIDPRGRLSVNNEQASASTSQWAGRVYFPID